MPNVAIIWDVENVTPPAQNSLFIDSLWEYAETLGRVVSARSYADWSAPGFSKLAIQLKKFHFYLVHVPSERKKKNSVDIQLVSDTLELLRLYDHIDTMLLVTGDSDFRPLLLTLRRAGKVTHIVCDIKTASQELLAIADSFKDYRDILPDEEDIETPSGSSIPISADQWFGALSEAVSELIKSGKPANLGALKVQMKILYPDFDETKIGYRRWSDFIGAAVKKGVVHFSEGDDKASILTPDSHGGSERGFLQKALKSLLEVLQELDGGSEMTYHEYSVVSSKLRDKKIDLKSLGFGQFKKFIQAAEVRGLVESSTKDMAHFVKRSGG